VEECLFFIPTFYPHGDILSPTFPARLPVFPSSAIDSVSTLFGCGYAALGYPRSNIFGRMAALRCFGTTKDSAKPGRKLQDAWGLISPGVSSLVCLTRLEPANSRWRASVLESIRFRQEVFATEDRIASCWVDRFFHMLVWRWQASLVDPGGRVGGR
jgi:hypothetical protein